MKKHIFICHASKDKEFAEKLAYRLQGEGIPVWIDIWRLKVGDPIHGLSARL